MNAIFYGVGVGPGDPELLTCKALRIMREADILAVPGEKKDASVAYQIACKAEPDIADKECLCIPMPMTKDEEKLRESHAAGAALGIGLVERSEQLHIVPSAYGVEQALKLPGTKVLMKVGKQLERVKEAAAQSGADIYMVENCGMQEERILHGVDAIPDESGYYSLVMIKENS